MSILIKGMEMPKSCWHCEFCRDGLDEHVQHYDYCVALDMNILISQTERHENCPLIEIKDKCGKWSDKQVAYRDEYGGMHFGYQCSVCGAIVNKTNYCGACGAKMENENVDA